MADINALINRRNAINRELAALKAEREQQFNQRDKLDAELDKLQDQRRRQFAGGDREGAAVLRNLEEQILDRQGALATQIGQTFRQLDSLEQELEQVNQQIQQLQTQQRARNAAGTPTVNSGAVVANAQTARDDGANQTLPAPQPAAPVVATNAVPTETAASQARVDAAAADPTVRTLQETQATSSQKPNNFGALQNSTGTVQDPRIVSNDRAGVGAASDDQRSVGQPQTNTVRNRLDELYGGVNNAIVAQDNVLDQFSSYTYSLSWYLMDRTAYQRLINQQKKTLNGYYLLVQSAGAGTSTGTNPATEQTLQFERQNLQSVPGNSSRSPFFPLDYAIDDLEVKVSYAAGSQSQSAAAYSELSFTITEPNGLTLLPNLYNAVQDLVRSGGEIDGVTNSVNYQAALYCMVIRFYGYDENGVLVQPITNQRDTTDSLAVVEKFIPFTLSKIDFSVGSKLVEYKIEGKTPDVATGLSTNRGSIPQSFDFTGATVRDLLVGTTVPQQPTNSDTARNGVPESPEVAEIDAEIKRFTSKNYDMRLPANQRYLAQLQSRRAAAISNANAAPPKANSAPKPTNTNFGTGLITALNNFQQQLVKKGVISQPDVYDVKFADNIISDATVVPPGGINKNRSGGTATNTAAEAKVPEKNSMNTTVRVRSVQAGTQIVQFIDEVIRNSSYVIDQQSVIYNERTKQYEKNGKPAQQFAWYNISVVAEPGLYDQKRNDYSYKITFFVTPYEVPMISEYFEPSGFRGVHKIYNYWFTGQNTQVLNFEQSFDQLWTQVLTADTTLIANLQTQKSQMNSREQWKKHYYPASGQSRQGGDGKTFEAGANAADYLYGPNYATIQLSILGDPAWLPNAQYGFNYNQFTTRAFYSDGTINNSASVPYFEFAWNRPVDYNLTTGLVDPGQNNYFANRSQGVAGLAAESQTYTATAVKSSFRGGRFSQELEGAWMFNQTKENKSANERTAQAAPDMRAGRGYNRAPAPPAAAVPTVRIAGDNSSTAQGVQQLLNPPTQSLNPTPTQIQSSQAYITARRNGLSAREAYEYAQQQFTQGRAGEAYTPQNIVREP